MTWMTWRQHRSEALVAALLVAVFAAIVLATGLPAHAAFTDDGLADCVGRTTDVDCTLLISRFQSDYGEPRSAFVALGLYAMPVLIGMFVGAPLLAREFEQGTWQLAWSQAVPRQRWIVVKLTLVLAATALAAAAVSALYMWWYAPHAQFQTRLSASYYGYVLPVFVAYTVFAVALGATAGRIIRRTLPAMALTVLVFLAVQVPFQIVARSQLQEPHTRIVPMFESHEAADNNGDWVVSTGFVDADGNAVSDSALLEVESNAGPDQGQVVVDYIREHGLRERVDYHPAASFWRFQFIEAGIFVAISAALVAALLWLVHRRPV